MNGPDKILKVPNFPIPGGWIKRRLDLGERELAYWAPAEPDAFLDDEETVTAHGPTADNPERSDVPLWPYVWPTAETMARRVFAHDWPGECSAHPKFPKALELGAGLGLVGLAGLAAGLSVTFSDYQDKALRAAAFNARQNGFMQSETRFLDWNAPLDEQFSVILGSDVIYEQAVHQPVLNVLDRMLWAWLGWGIRGGRWRGRFSPRPKTAITASKSATGKVKKSQLPASRNSSFSFCAVRRRAELCEPFHAKPPSDRENT